MERVLRLRSGIFFIATPFSIGLEMLVTEVVMKWRWRVFIESKARSQKIALWFFQFQPKLSQGWPIFIDSCLQIGIHFSLKVDAAVATPFQKTSVGNKKALADSAWLSHF